jgi:hypothetical protein
MCSTADVDRREESLQSPPHREVIVDDRDETVETGLRQAVVGS